MPLDPSQLELLGDQIIIVADVIALVAAQMETENPSDNGDNARKSVTNEEHPAFNLNPTQLNILGAWLTVIGDGLALLATLREAQADK